MRTCPRLLLAALVFAACSPGASKSVPVRGQDRQAVADTIRNLLTTTYDLSKGDVVRRFMQLYPDTGRVVSASIGTYTTTRDSLQRQVEAFWKGTGVYMRHPEWRWESMAIDVLGPNAAVVTARYLVPHHTPAGAPHIIGGAWTSVWVNRDGRWQIIQEHLSDLPRAAAAGIEATMDSIPAAAPDTGRSRR